ncbi:MSMEG_0569 family flavin-dependent oxidoreductase [Herbaspirillum sp. WKF16]|uniref:MSMEG_0569 family flavin-dependent oxidoreductase n=1 Tax=Herbaspirillum sp. WKF16 TaxID=3028312 RepID=UPI0023A97B32|nr:MSMEG_0569 family flavin-dependent oxidoreductase [Herbaspirillum sp. WKF16]WDZ94179.1 MSMEG_0569 family flavin-dependent oxidoreductase [Herbaspirillum sp. WKF16]
MNTPTPGAPRHHSVIIIGGGQAGLSASWYLKDAGIDHLVLEKHRIGHAWRSERWDTFCLVTPNWQCTLPGYPYRGSDPHGFMKKDEIVEYIDGFAASFAPPVREGVTVSKLWREGALWRITGSDGEYSADQVVVAVGGYHIPVVPRAAEKLPPGIAQIHSSDYLNPESLPEGEVLVVGTGQSGCQIAEDLHLAGRRVHLCVGDAPRVARAYRGRDVVEWLDKMKYYDLPVDRHPLGTGVREKTNHYVTGRDGGRDIDLRKFALEGMQLYGRFDGIDDGVAQFGAGLRGYLDDADAVSESIKDSIDKFIAANGIEAPHEARYAPVWQPASDAPQRLDLRASAISAVVWCIGFRTDFSWIAEPIFDGRGYPGHERGVTAAPGLYFLGLPWQYTWGSGRFSGIARDAHYLFEHIAALRARSGQAELSQAA